jgi:hypothetical protein
MALFAVASLAVWLLYRWVLHELRWFDPGGSDVALPVPDVDCLRALALAGGAHAAELPLRTLTIDKHKLVVEVVTTPDQRATGS